MNLFGKAWAGDNQSMKDDKGVRISLKLPKIEKDNKRI